jgi:hypothetical protein
VEYTAQSIQQMLKDIKPYLTTSTTLVKKWCILVDEKDQEYKDTHYFMTNKFGLYKVPVGVSKFRATFEADCNKQRLGGAIKKGEEPTHIPYQKLLNYLPKTLDEFEVATSYTLDFDPDWGLVCHAKADSGLSKKINLTLLYPFEDIVKEFPEQQGYALYLQEGMSVVPVAGADVIGFVTPIYADKTGKNKE